MGIKLGYIRDCGYSRMKNSRQVNFPQDSFLLLRRCLNIQHLSKINTLSRRLNPILQVLILRAVCVFFHYESCIKKIVFTRR